jgi:hypothetical protein
MKITDVNYFNKSKCIKTLLNYIYFTTEWQIINLLSSTHVFSAV